MSGWRFRPQPLPAAIVFALTLLLLSLAVWQLRRADDKRALLATFDSAAEVLDWQAGDAPPPLYQQVRLTGRWLPARQILLEGFAHQGRPGLQVLTPLLVGSDEVVLVNRGWVPWTGDRGRLPALPAREGTVEVVGRAAPFPEPGMRLRGAQDASDADWPRLAVYPDAQRVEGWLGLTVAERIVLLDPAQADGFVREWRPAQFPPSRHVGYAVQWFALAAALLVLFFIASRENIEE